MDQYLIKFESSLKPYGLELDRFHDNKFLAQTSCHIRDKRQRTASGYEFMQCTELGWYGLVTTTDYQTMRISWPAQDSWSIGFSGRLWLSSKFGRTDVGYKITLVT